jgi:hypothetical protein
MVEAAGVEPAISFSACTSAKFLAKTETAAMQNLAEEFGQYRAGPSRWPAP